ncbi:MAG: response regulator transcription factor [Chloroflexi bacterium]|nr:response regulator transcription factor [Chloroflexota bacterium]
MTKTDPRTILYIEDDLEMINLVTVILNRSGYVVKSANSGSKGLELIEQELPDLILLDLMMPEMDGWTLYQQLKSTESTSNIPVIIITAKSQPIDRVLGLHVAKVDDYIAKPFHPQELLASINRVLESKAGKQK